MIFVIRTVRFLGHAVTHKDSAPMEYLDAWAEVREHREKRPKGWPVVKGVVAIAENEEREAA